MTTCCHSILAVDHPAYQANVVMVPRDACNLDFSPDIMPTARIYMQDWDDTQLGTPPPLAKGVPESSTPRTADAPRPWRKTFETRLPAEGVSLQDIFQTVGPPRVIGLEEGEAIPRQSATVPPWKRGLVVGAGSFVMCMSISLFEHLVWPMFGGG
mmetsp:Transcript_58951/g.117118  ORF Transcript_58951/g.117118 Transcript_58951/m.117118 type:complete len:155 (-) Transcript_58951:200-664(-)